MVDHAPQMKESPVRYVADKNLRYLYTHHNEKIDMDSRFRFFILLSGFVLLFSS